MQEDAMAIEVFISYSHQDQSLRTELEKHLSNLKRQNIITSWYDGDIIPGVELEPEIMNHLKRAQIILLLVSADFIASDFCYTKELKEAFARHDANQARIIPILLRPTDWQGTPFSKLKMLPTDAKAVTRWPTLDDAFEDVVTGIRAAIDDLISKGQSSYPSPTKRNIPFERNPLFTGREEILERLHATLNAGKTTALTQAISGMGGIGKTQTAVEYAYRYQDDYECIYWIKSESRESIISDFVTMAYLLDLTEKHEQDQSQVIAAVKRWFQKNTGWLLIFDNADDLTIIRDFLQQGVKGHILLTTREQATGRIAQRIEIERLEPEEGALFLLRRAGILTSDAPFDAALPTDREAARKIVQAMDGLPLALDQAGAFIDETKCSLTDYLDFFETRQADLLKRRGRLATDHPDSVAATFSLSFEKVQKAHPAAADLLCLCAFLDPDGIQEEIFTEGASELGPTLKPIAADRIKLNETIGTLLTYSLLRRSPVHSLTIHRLVQVVLKQGMKKSTQRRWAERVVRAVNLAFPEVDYENWLRCQQFMPHVLACKALIEQWNMTLPEAAQLLNDAGYYLRESAQYKQAEPLLQRALDIHERVLGPDHPNTAASLNNLALLYQGQGNYKQAEPLYQRALDIREHMLGPDHVDTATSLNNLALLYDNQGKFELAEPLYERAIAIDEKALGPEHPGLATKLNNLALLYYNQGKYELAEPLYHRAIAIKEKTLGLEHPSLSASLCGLAKIYSDQEKYELAEPLYQRTIAIDEKIYGLDHPEVATDLNNQAILYRSLGKFELAEYLNQRALDIRERVLGPDHPDTATSLNDLAGLYRSLGKYELAEPLYQRALAIYEKVLGPDHPWTATGLNNLAILYKAQGKYEQAEPLYLRAIAIGEKTLGSEHPNLATWLNNLALLYQAQGKYYLAEPLFQRAQAIQERKQKP
jgi:tetratricopeptide (TPR) repeat protein